MNENDKYQVLYNQAKEIIKKLSQENDLLRVENIEYKKSLDCLLGIKNR